MSAPWEIPDLQFSLDAATDLSGKQYHFVTPDADSKFGICTAGDGGWVLQNKPEAGKAATVQKGGITRVVAGDAITAPAYVTSDANGKAVTATTGDIINGYAITSASAADEQVTMVDMFVGYVKPA